MSTYDLATLLQNVGRTIPPADPRIDLSGNGIVDLRDREILLTLTNNPCMSGDFNNDGCVDSSDLQILLQHVTMTVPPANPRMDFNINRVIDMDDAAVLRTMLGTGCAPRP